MMKLITPYTTPHALRSQQASVSQELKHFSDEVEPSSTVSSYYCLVGLALSQFH